MQTDRVVVASESPPRTRTTGRCRVGEAFAGAFRIESQLAVGARNAVYAVTDLSGARGALKVPLDPPSERTTSALEREARISSLAAKAGCPKVLTSGAASDGAPYIVFELMTGLTLEQRQHRRGGRFDPLTALFIAERVAAILDRLHRLGIVHRDVRPANVFITAHGEVRLFDFGHATSLSEPFDARDRRAADPGSDLFALGTMLAYMLTGSTEAAGRLSRPTTSAPAIDGELEHLPSRALALLEAMLCPDFSKRFPSASALRDAIAEVSGELTAL